MNGSKLQLSLSYLLRFLVYTLQKCFSKVVLDRFLVLEFSDGSDEASDDSSPPH
jgi:hypothetical protein